MASPLVRFVFMHRRIGRDEQLHMAHFPDSLRPDFEARVVSAHRAREEELVEVDDLFLNPWQPNDRLVIAMLATSQNVFTHGDVAKTGLGSTFRAVADYFSYQHAS